MRRQLLAVPSPQCNYSLSQEEFITLKRRNLQLEADQKAMSARIETLLSHKSALEAQVQAEGQKHQHALQELAQRDETIRKLKRNIMQKFLKEKIGKENTDSELYQSINQDSRSEEPDHPNMLSIVKITETSAL